MTELEKYFSHFRNNIVGIDQSFSSLDEFHKIIYADWVASGRLYKPIEEKMMNDFGPFVGNTHTETTVTGTLMTKAYHKAHEIIKDHVKANEKDVIITAGTGMTGVVNKFQRLLGLSVPEQIKPFVNFNKNEKPVVFITHMEHHSNHTSWLETLADVVVIEPNRDGLVDLNHLEQLLKLYETRNIKIGSFTACSNVTGIQTDYHKMAKLMHEHNGLCFVDFAASAPYVDIDMHPSDPMESLDAVFFSPHKFLGGPGTCGVIVFNSDLYNRQIPDQPGGGTVDWTNPWGQHKYINDIEAREDGGTPGFLQAIKAALCIELKEQMGTENIIKREEELLEIAIPGLRDIPGVHLLADNVEERLGILSFYVEDCHFNLIVKLLNDKFGIQTRGGCSCAGTYGHYLLHVDPNRSKRITDKINEGDLSEKPGWIRLSLHQTMLTEELHYILASLRKVIENKEKWNEFYTYSNKTNEFELKNSTSDSDFINNWFKFS